jgi:hypothetical protein
MLPGLLHAIQDRFFVRDAWQRKPENVQPYFWSSTWQVVAKLLPSFSSRQPREDPFVLHLLGTFKNVKHVAVVASYKLPKGLNPTIDTLNKTGLSSVHTYVCRSRWGNACSHLLPCCPKPTTVLRYIAPLGRLWTVQFPTCISLAFALSHPSGFTGHTGCKGSVSLDAEDLTKSVSESRHGLLQLRTISIKRLTT